MFRRLSNSLPKDIGFPTDLKELGYFVNEKDQVRKISDPEAKYQFRINRNERVNEVCKEAANACIRKIVLDHLEQLNMETVRLPLGALEDEPHVPILVSKGILEKKRILLYLGETHQDLGIFSYRVMFEEGIHIGSAVDLVTYLLNGSTKSNEDIPGIIIANPGQFLWYRGGKRAVTRTEWYNLPRQSAVHEAFRIDELKNKIPQNEDFLGHVNYIFEHVLNTIVSKEAIIDIVGMEYTGSAMLEFLAHNWSQWSTRIGGICIGAPQHQIQDLLIDEKASESFLEFMTKRCRAYFTSTAAPGTVLPGQEDLGCECYASGEEFYEENIFIRSWSNMVEFFDQIHNDKRLGDIEIKTELTELQRQSH